MRRFGKLTVLFGAILLSVLATAPVVSAAEPAPACPAPSGEAPGTWAFLYPLMLLFIFLGCVGALYAEGMWSNAIRLVNVVTAGLLAVNFWEPLARWLESRMPTFTYYVDLMALWGLFCVFMLVFRVLTGVLSRVKVKFLGIADRIGSVAFGAWVGWVMVCFTVFSLHTAPLSRNFIFGGFDPDKRMFVMAPDRQWLGFCMKVSRGTFCRYGSDEEVQQGAYGWEADPSSLDQKLCVFDREARFIPKYAARRSALERNVNDKQATRVEEGSTPKR